MLLGVYENKAFREQICYILELFFSIYGIEWKTVSYGELSQFEGSKRDVIITYGRTKIEGGFPYRIHIYPSSLFGPDYLKPSSMPSEPLEYFGDLPIIYQGEPTVKGHVRTNDMTETDIDIIASSFFMLTRYEEVLVTERDTFGRFPGKASLAHREGFLHRPVVNQYIDLLWKWISAFDSGLVRKELWKGKDFAVALTHDVDKVNKYRRLPPLRTMASAILKNGAPKRSLDVLWDYINAKIKGDPFDTFEYFMGLSEMYGFRMTFYFMSGGDSAYDRRYRIDNPQVVSLARVLKKRGNEIGLHSSYHSCNDHQMLKRERVMLENVVGEPICGVRQHYLCWKTPESWEAREKAGFRYDATLTFADCEGFRCGFCRPYRPFDLVENRVLDVWEIPTTVMDRTLFSYQKLASENAKKRITSLIDQVRTHRGVFVLLWHNSSLDELRNLGSHSVYEEVLQYLGGQNVFSDTVQGIIRAVEDHVKDSLCCKTGGNV
jgi:hypothetical protein